MAVTILLADDSAIVRGLMSRALAAEDGLQVVGSAANGSIAITMAKEYRPDIILLDIEMPVMDGLTALPQLLAVSPGSKVIVISTLSSRNAGIGMQALAAGATDYLAKPSSRAGEESAQFYRQLICKIKGLAAPTAAAAVAPLAASLPQGVKALAIASSTGGPQALLSLFAQLSGHLTHIPIFITQHMPPIFTKTLAEHLARAGNRPCGEAADGQKVQPGHAYVAPGDYHMLAHKDASGQVLIRLSQDAPENYCRPSADPMLRSLVNVYGAHLALAVLTGMGHDGLAGARELAAAGGGVLAQDQASCVVYGMPKAVADAGLCRAILPLEQMGVYLIEQIGGAA